MGRPLKTETRDGWNVVLAYEDQGRGPYLIDLSHIPKWDIQDSHLHAIQPLGRTIPESPGSCSFEDGVLVTRINGTRASLWHLSLQHPRFPEGPAFTDVTDTYAVMVLLGKEVYSIMESLTPLDLSSPQQAVPFLVQGPVLRVTCKILVLPEKSGLMALLVACARGYGQSMAEAILQVARPRGLCPAGETAFHAWLDG
jgi:hypothetical protein